MDKDAGEQASAAVKDRHQQEAHCNGKDDLAQIACQIHPAAVEQVDDMPDAKGHAGDDNGGSHIVPCNRRKQEPPEDHFLQGSDAEHTCNAANRFRRGVIEGSAVPEVSRCQNDQRHIVKKPPGRNGGTAKPIPLLQLVFTDKGEKHDGLQDAKASACGVFNADRLIERICQGLQHAVNHDTRNRKGQLVFLI